MDRREASLFFRLGVVPFSPCRPTRRCRRTAASRPPLIAKALGAMLTLDGRSC